MKNKITLLAAMLLVGISFAQHTQSTNISNKPLKPTNGECYCNYEIQFSQYLDFTNNMPVNIIRRQWFEGQKEILRNELQNRYNQPFNSFEDGMKHLFKEAFTDDYENVLLNPIRASDLAARNAIYPNMVDSNAKWRVFNFQMNSNSQVNLGDLSYNNKPVKDMTYNEPIKLGKLQKLKTIQTLPPIFITTIEY